MKLSNYERVVPRDLFNEANLLKCIGKLVLEIEEWVFDECGHVNLTEQMVRENTQQE